MTSARMFSTPTDKQVENLYLKRKEEAKSEIEAYNKTLSRSGLEYQLNTNEVTKRVRTRYAPSPTGAMHIGGLRTALYNYLFAKQHAGDFLLRIEDTDKNREVEGSTLDIVNALSWSGLDWSEGPGSTFKSEKEAEDDHGPCGPYYQSQRLKIYHKFIDTLVEVSLRALYR